MVPQKARESCEPRRSGSGRHPRAPGLLLPRTSSCVSSTLRLGLSYGFSENGPGPFQVATDSVYPSQSDVEVDGVFPTGRWEMDPGLLGTLESPDVSQPGRFPRHRRSVPGVLDPRVSFHDSGPLGVQESYPDSLSTRVSCVVWTLSSSDLPTGRSWRGAGTVDSFLSRVVPSSSCPIPVQTRGAICGEYRVLSSWVLSTHRTQEDGQLPTGGRVMFEVCVVVHVISWRGTGPTLAEPLSLVIQVYWTPRVRRYVYPP